MDVASTEAWCMRLRAIEEDNVGKTLKTLKGNDGE